MSPAKRCAKKHAKARHRRRLTARERLERDRRQAQHAAEALQQALDDLGLPEDLVTEIEGRLLPVHKAPCGRTLQHQPLDQGPARGTLAAYVPRLITSPSS